jgi:3-methyl-2-oxobutanoate hydroxymethyltransferase
MSMYHNRPTVADMRAMKTRGQKISMLYLTTLEEAAATNAAGISMLSIVKGTIIVVGVIVDERKNH